MKRYSQVIFSLLDTPAFGGAEQYMFSHLYFLYQQGYEIVLAINTESVKKEIRSRLTASEQKHFHIIDAPYVLDAIGNWKGLVKYFLSLPRAISWCWVTLRQLKREYQQVICLWPGFSDRLTFSFIPHYLNIPLIWIDIGPLEPIFTRTWGFPKLLYRFAEPYPNHILTTSQFTKDSVLRNTHFSDDMITLVYPGTTLFNSSQLSMYRKQAKQWLHQQHLTADFYIGVVARLAHENEIDVTIDAFATYLHRNPKAKITLLIIGDGPARNDLTAQAARLHISDHVKFCGFVTEAQKRVILSACDLFIFPRAWDWDGFGMTTIEAMSLGLPVLTTNFGPQIEIVTNNQEGFRYQPHDSRDLAAMIAKMVKLTSGQRTRMGQAGLKRVQYFSDKNSHATLLSVITTLIDTKNSHDQIN